MNGTMEALYETVVDPKPEAVINLCSDVRLQPSFDDFIFHGLGLNFRQGHYARIIAAGGPGIVAHSKTLPKQFSFFRRRLELHCGLSESIRRLILIGHEDCHWYTSLSQLSPAWFKQLSPNVHLAPYRDLQRLLYEYSIPNSPIGALTRRHDLSLEAYFARFHNEQGTQKARFERVYC